MIDNKLIDSTYSFRNVIYIILLEYIYLISHKEYLK